MLCKYHLSSINWLGLYIRTIKNVLRAMSVHLAYSRAIQLISQKIEEKSFKLLDF